MMFCAGKFRVECIHFNPEGELNYVLAVGAVCGNPTDVLVKIGFFKLFSFSLSFQHNI